MRQLRRMTWVSFALFAASAMSAQAAVAPAKVVVSQVYGGGGNSGATYSRDFVELFNSGGQAQSLSGWSVQYTSYAATGSWSVTSLGSLTLQPGQYLLIGLGSGTSGGAALPTVDVSGTTAMSASSGHIALVASTTALVKGCPASGAALDLVGYGKSATCTEGSAKMTSDLSATKAALRGGWGCIDTDNNAADFSVTGPSPRNSATPTDVCVSSGLPTNIKASGSASPNSVIPGESMLLTVTVTPGANPASSGLTVTADLSSIASSASQSLYDNGSNGDAVTGDNLFSLRTTVSSSATLGSKTLPVSVRDSSSRSASVGIGLNVIASLDAINKIQGTGRESPYTIGSTVVTEGIVTAVTYSGFFLQTLDGQTDADAASSEGLHIYSRNPVPSAAAVGNRVRVTGTVSEYTDSDNLNQMSVTELTGPSVSLISSEQTLPAAIVITEADANAASAIDRLERYEGMRVSVPSLKTVGPVLGTIDEANATSTSDGVFIGALPTIARPFRTTGIGALDVILDSLPTGVNPPIFDTNPERIRVDSAAQTGATKLSVDVGDTVSGLVGVLDYAAGAYTVLPDVGTVATITPGATITAAAIPLGDEITIGGFNLFHFYDTTDNPATTESVLTQAAFDNRLKKTSNAICAYVRNPDILGVLEAENIETLTALADAINTQAGNALFPNSCTENPKYVAYLIEGNDIGGIDIGFLIKTADAATGVPRVELLKPIEQVGKDATFDNPDGSTSTLNDRPPLVLEARTHHSNGASVDVTVIANHLRSFGGINSTEPGSSGWPTEGDRVRAKRAAQALYLAELIKARQDADPNEKIVVLGDFNAYEFNDGYVDSMGIVTGREAGADQVVNYVDSPIVEPLTNVTLLSDAADRYSYSYDGNAQTIDHIIVNDPILETMTARIEHPRIDADFGADNYGDYTVPVRVSDHEPVVLYLGEPSFSTADLSVAAKANAASVEAGKPAVFTVTAGNAGTGSASGAKLDLSIAVLPSTVAVTPASDWTCGAPVADGSTATLVHCNRDSMASGITGNFTVTLTTTTAQAGQTLSLGAAISSGATDPVPANNSGSAQVSLTAPAVSVDLSAKVTAPTTLLFKQKGGAFTVDVQNLSTNTAKGGVLTLDLTAASSVATLTAPSGWTCTLLSATSPAKWSCKTSAGDVAGSSKATFSMFVKPTSLPATYKLTATITTSSSDTNTANNSASASKTVN
jgi:predicted extracellular nuclease